MSLYKDDILWFFTGAAKLTLLGQNSVREKWWEEWKEDFGQSCVLVWMVIKISLATKISRKSEEMGDWVSQLLQ